MTDIDKYKMVDVDEYPLKGNQIHLDLMAFPDLFPTGEFGEFHPRELALSNCEYIKSKLKNKDSRYRKKPEYVFFLQHQKVMRELKSGIYNLLKTTKQRDRSVQSLLARFDYELEGNLLCFRPYAVLNSIGC